MVRLKKGQAIGCVPCGRQLVVSRAGISKTTIWCCERPMRMETKKTKTKGMSKRASFRRYVINKI
ncbi:MAG: hypothetical protein KAS70_02615 [Planctomycetes bacterium]|nr:hypothetical protein [Planctomycetota bacterium]